MMSMATFDFDQWAALARTDTAEFERRRVAALDAACEDMGGKALPHIAAMCWRMEVERRRTHASAPLYQRLFGLMWDRFLDMESALCSIMMNGQAYRPAVEGRVLPLRRITSGGCYGRDGE